MTHTINEWLRLTPASGGVRPSLVTKDGSVLSVQASRWHRSVPASDTGPWTYVEVWIWPEGDTFFAPADADAADEPKTVHVNTVDRWILLHGGITATKNQKPRNLSQ